MKRNIDDFNGMTDFIISIITVVAWVLIGAIVTVGYFTIETKGESVILSFVSTIFTIISSLGVLATIIVYFKQKNDSDTLQNKELSKKKDAIRIITKKNVVDINYQVKLIAEHVKSAMFDNALKIANSINTTKIEKCLLDSSEVDHDMFHIISDLLDTTYANKNSLIDEIEQIKARHYKKISEKKFIPNEENKMANLLNGFIIDMLCNTTIKNIGDILSRLDNEKL